MATTSETLPVEEWQRPLGPTEVVVPSNVEEALAAIHDREGARFLAGGTYLVRFGRWGGTLPPLLVYLGRLDELRRVERRDGRVFVGSLAVHSQLESHPLLADGVLAAAVGEIAGPAVRNLATLGGNILIDWDLVPALMALDADVHLVDTDGARQVTISELYAADGSPRVPPTALLEGVTLDTDLDRHAYQKIARRRSVARAIVGVGVALSLGGEVCRDVRIGMGGSSLHSRRLTECEEALRGSRVDDEAVARAGELAWAAAADAEDDVEASAWYAREMARVMTERAVCSAAGRPAI